MKRTVLDSTQRWWECTSYSVWPKLEAEVYTYAWFTMTSLSCLR